MDNLRVSLSPADLLELHGKVELALCLSAAHSVVATQLPTPALCQDTKSAPDSIHVFPFPVVKPRLLVSAA